MQQSSEITGFPADVRPARPSQEHRAEVKRLTAEILRLSEEVRRATSRANKLLNVSTALSEARSVEDVTQAVLTKGVAVLEAARAVLISCDGSRIRLLGTLGIDPELEASLANLTLESELPVVQAVRSGEMTWIESSEDYKRRFGASFSGFGALADMQTYVAAPLIHAGETVGAVALHFREVGALGAADRAFTLLLAQVAATALHRARSYDAAQELRRRAELVANARAEVLGVVAHDLRNPLSLIVTTTELLEEEDLEAEQRRKVLEIAKRAGKQMNRLIGDLLDTVQLESGRLNLVLEDLDVATLFAHLADTFGPLAARKGISLVGNTPAEGLSVPADEFRLLQAMGNLLGNAIKFTPEGGEVTFSARHDGTSVLFEVSDTGPGIPPEQVTHLFEQFWQARKNDKRGVGLGLTIAKGIVEAHGGRIWVNSAPGEGSTFAFAIPAGDRA
ncbi:MAG TPA: GAF domain-containing sensor histidine kinase [Gemmatimonadaceae bacterium]|nr:GAF domain-containing sensor histidine kinase [Gemmatimonadaceae bacterium]